MAAMDIHQRDDLAFPQSLPEFQRLFPDDAACAAYLGRTRWPDGFVCPHCGQIAEPFRIVTRPGVLECRACRRQAGLLVGTVMERSHTPLSVWFWAAYLVASQTPGMSAVQFQRQLGLTRYETAFGILHKLRAGMVRPDQDRIGGRPKEHVEVDETWVGGRTRGEGRGIHHKTLVAAAVEVRHRKPGTAQDKRKDGRYAGRVRLAIAADRSADSLCGFVENAVMPGSLIVTDDWSGYASLRKRGYDGGIHIRPGVIVHIHDTFWPFEYPWDWVVNENRSWNEFYAARAFLTDNENWRISVFQRLHGQIRATYD